MGSSKPRIVIAAIEIHNCDSLNDEAIKAVLGEITTRIGSQVQADKPSSSTTVKQRKCCKTPGCGRSNPRSRGLCASCIVAAWRMVRSGEITWDELERMGLSTPTNEGNYRPSGLFASAVHLRRHVEAQRQQGESQ